MFRRGVWDLPKGKIDKGESKDAAAVREVQEETGLKEVYLENLLCETYHTYKDKDDKRILKRTYWYKMSTPEMEVVPQTEEDIEALLWIEPKKFLADKEPIYNTIRIVVEEVLV